MKKHRLRNTVLALLAGALLITAAGCGSTQSAAEEDGKTVHAVTGGSPAPYVSVDENNEYTGYDIEVLREVFNRLPQYTLDLKTAEFDAMFTGLTAGNYDLAVNNFSYSEDRAESYYYSYPYDEITYVFVQRAGDEPLTSLEDAANRGYKIESNAGGNVTNAIERWNAENPDKQIEITYSEADMSVWFEHIEDGTSDFRIDDLPIYTNYVEEFNFQNLQATELSEEETAKISTALDAYFLFPKNDEGQALREDVNGALKAMKEDGTLRELSLKYFGADQAPADDKFEKTIN
ncbi:MAG: transporter substrate-binding domain-containing protein [Eubacterium sp.]|nr:transporter substrate-binding domain-containing protein [Eubacterium sp.]